MTHKWGEWHCGNCLPDHSVRALPVFLDNMEFCLSLHAKQQCSQALLAATLYVDPVAGRNGIRRPAHLSPRLRKQGLQDEAVALQRGDHVCEGLGARHQERPQHHAEHPPRATQLPLQPLLAYPGKHALAHHLVLHLHAMSHYKARTDGRSWV